MKIRRAGERGHADHGWLKTFHTFSFADYYDPANMGFRALRVINDDYVAPGQGFGKHPHRDMEIVTYVLDGALAHKDSMGNGTTMRAHEVQRMSAGTGVTHSEFNPSIEEPVHLLQIWILPEKRGTPPSYEQKMFPREEKLGRLRLVASRDGREGSVTVAQDVSVFASILEGSQRATHALAPGRHAWVHVATGSLKVNGTELSAGDAAAISEPGAITFEGTSGAEILVFDLA